MFGKRLYVHEFRYFKHNFKGHFSQTGIYFQVNIYQKEEHLNKNGKYLF